MIVGEKGGQRSMSLEFPSQVEAREKNQVARSIIPIELQQCQRESQWACSGSMKSWDQAMYRKVSSWYL
jgi:hypothetical protein